VVKDNCMKILMIAPEPFFTPRGTPFSEYYRIKCLLELGHSVDLVTYPIGEDVDLKGLRIIRAPRIPGIKSIKIGPSMAKIPLDASLFYAAWRQLERAEYDALHSHEEAGIMCVQFAQMYGLPHIYDMHSSLPDQLKNFRFTENKLITGAFDWIEKTVLTTADGVIAICPSLVDKALEIEPRAYVELIENTAESHAVDDVSENEIEALRAKLGLHGKKIVLYIGTFETYQGLEILLESGKDVFEGREDTVFLLVGGREEQVESIKELASDIGIIDNCRFTGMVPHDQVPAYLKLSDLLVSPRRYGTNTPLKIYSYLRSGRPIVATNLYTHTQVLNEDVSELVDPTAEAFAKGINKILNAPEYGKQIADAAYQLAERKYSYDQYVSKTERLYNTVMEQRS
jgi:glycosyltransferase involved in cell wall biosynthesis